MEDDFSYFLETKIIPSCQYTYLRAKEAEGLNFPHPISMGYFEGEKEKERNAIERDRDSSFPKTFEIYVSGHFVAPAAPSLLSLSLCVSYMYKYIHYLSLSMYIYIYRLSLSLSL